MNWEAISTISEVVGTLAIIISLLYLAKQVKSQSSETQSASMHIFLAGFRETIANYSNHELANLFTRANHDIDSLTETEKLQIASSAQQLHRLYEEAFNLHNHGRLADDVWMPMVRQYASFMAAPSVRYVWDIRKHYYNDHFRAFVDNMDISDYSFEKQRR